MVTSTVAARPTIPAQQHDIRLDVLQLTLGICRAETDDELISRTLAAAAATTGAGIGGLVDHNGRLHILFEDGANYSLAMRPDMLRRLRAQPGRPIGEFANWGLPKTIATRLGAGALFVTDSEPERLHPMTAELLTALAAHATTRLEQMQHVRQLRIRAESDPLTGLRHHRTFGERLGSTLSLSTAVIVIDVDGFKHINDEYGHLIGDRVLIELVQALQSVLRDEDELYRIGGDEFAVMINVATRDEASSIAERLLLAARQAGQTISIGVAMHAATETGRDTLRRADDALYAAKRAGRNTMRMASPAEKLAAGD